MAKLLLKNQDLDISRVIFERNSRNTYENTLFSFEEVKPTPVGNWILITTAGHMPRSMGIFCKVGWPMIPYPVDHRTMRGNLIRIELGLFGLLGKLTIP